jgi:uncharacterized protein YndB with AHSA1/START domain
MREARGQAEIFIAAPVEQVYAYLADFTRHPEWAQNLSAVRPLAAGQPAVGSTFRCSEMPPPGGALQTARMMAHFVTGLLSGASGYSEATITALDAPRRIAWTAGIPKGAGFFNQAEWEFCLEAQGAGTRVVQRFWWKPQEPAAERMTWAAGPAGLERAAAVNLARLKRRLENGSV